MWSQKTGKPTQKKKIKRLTKNNRKQRKNDSAIGYKYDNKFSNQTINQTLKTEISKTI
jgi:hypothetical protein